MRFRRRLLRTHSPQRGEIHASLYLVCAMMLFWTLSEGIVSFIVPLKLEETGVSATMLGIILGTSSVAGALFDFVAVRLFKDTYYKRIFGIMFALALLFPLILMQASTWILFVLGMIVWGIYYDLRNIGNYDYIARTAHKDDHSHGFGMLQTCQSIGWIAGPIIVGFLVHESVGWEPFAAIYIFLTIALLFYLMLLFATGKRTSHAHEAESKECRRGTLSTVRMLRNVGSVMLPSLVVIFMLNFMDAFFWSIGPIFAESLGLDGLAGIFMTAWSLPGLLLGWTAGHITRTFGKERVAHVTLLIGSLILIPLLILDEPFLILASVFVASMSISISWPAIQAAFTGYISDRTDLEKEIESLVDLYTNLGYVFGPIAAGIIADTLGFGHAFGLLGILTSLVALFLLLTARKKIDLVKHGPPLICD